MNNAMLAIILSMKDGASEGLNNFNNNTKKNIASLREMRMGLMALGTTLTSAGSLLNRLDNDMAKSAGGALVWAGSIIATVGGILQMIRYLPGLIAQLRSLAVIQAILNSLAGPGGWAKLAVGAAIAGGAVYGMNKVMSSNATPQKTTIENKIYLDSRQLGSSVKKDIILQQQRNSTSGIR